MSGSLAEHVAKLRLPKPATRGHHDVSWQLQTYHDLAEQTKRNNRDFLLNKDLMDKSLRTAGSQVRKNANEGRVTDKESSVLCEYSVTRRNALTLKYSHSVSSKSRRIIGKPEKDQSDRGQLKVG